MPKGSNNERPCLLYATRRAMSLVPRQVLPLGFLLAGLLSTTSLPSVHAADFFVSLHGNHVWPYKSWNDAATNIHPAILASADGDTVTVTDGVFVVYSQVELTNAVTLKSVNGPVKTSIVGAHPATSNRCFRITHSNAVIEGFTVSNGWAEDGQRGGGILCDPAGTIRDCTVVHNRATTGAGIACARGVVYNCLVASNTATLRGGGIAVEGTGEVDQCKISDNTAQHGGGVYCSGNGAVRNSIIARNSASIGPGGALCMYGGRLLACTVVGNQSGDAAGGIGCSEGGIALRCLITGNNALSAGGGCVLDGLLDGGTAANCIISSNHAEIGGGVALGDMGVLRNCTVVTNVATGTGGGVYARSSAAVYSTVLYYNSASNAPNWFNDHANENFIASCTFPMPPGQGNITNAPQFMNATSGDYHLAAGSPCIDAGTNIVTVTNDLDGIPRPLDGNGDGTPQWDIGAYEYLNPAGDTDQDGLTDTNELYGTGTSPIAADTDGDDQNDGDEVIADTDPLDDDSLLAILGIRRETGGTRLDWKGGRDAWQFLETSTDLRDPNGWTAIYGLPPPTPITNAVIHFGTSNRVQFYRIRAKR